VSGSVTRFGEIAPVFQKNKSLAKDFELFVGSIWQNFEPTLP